MTRSAVCLAIALALSTLAGAQVQRLDPQLAANLRQHNTALLRARHLDRAVTVRDARLVLNRSGLASLLSFCQQYDITAVYVGTPASLLWSVEDAASDFRWRALLSGLHRQGVRIFATAGDGGSTGNYGSLLTTTDRIMRLAAVGLPGEQFDGLLVDLPALSALVVAPASGENSVAPLGTASGTGTTGAQPGTSAGQPSGRSVLNPVAPRGKTVPLPELLTSQPQLIGCLDAIARLRHHVELRYANQPFLLGVTLPASLNTPVFWRGEAKEAREWFADLADFVVVHNLPNDTTDVANQAAGLMAYCGSARKPVVLRLELRPALYDLPELMSLFQRDQLFVEQTVSDILDSFGNRPGFGGFLLDDWVHLASMPTVMPTTPPVVSPTSVISDNAAAAR